jgi:hypothetical protein
LIFAALSMVVIAIVQSYYDERLAAFALMLRFSCRAL